MFQMRCLIIRVMNIFKNMYQFKITQRIHYYSILILEHFRSKFPLVKSLVTLQFK